MAIVGHGIDLVEIARIARLLLEHGQAFKDRCFSPAEQAYCDAGDRRQAERYAARFACKEAVMKALATGWREGIAWSEIEVVRQPRGEPTLRVTGQCAAVADSLGIQRWHVSLSHAETHAIASVIAESA